MSDKIPLYRHSLLEAKRCNEMDLWRASHKANIECKKTIEKTLSQRFDGSHLMDGTAKILFEACGIDRVNWVLANTIQHSDWDGRYSHSNKEWAKGFIIPTSDARDQTVDYLLNSHPVVLDGLVTMARKEYVRLNLFDHSHCENNSSQINYENKVLVLMPEVLKDEYKSPEYQLVYASGGFGCSPTASGRKVYVQFLKDGEETFYNRQDFIGVLSHEHLPAWAAEKLEEINHPAMPDQDGGISM